MNPTGTIESRPTAWPFQFCGAIAAFGLLLTLGIVNSLIGEKTLPHVNYDYSERHENMVASQSGPELIPALRVAAAVDFDNSTAQLRLLLAGYEANDAEAVALGLKGLLRQTPDDPELHNQLAIALFANDPSEALRHSRIAVALDPENPRWRTTHAAILLHRGNKGEAAEQYRKALELDPDLESARRVLGTDLSGY